MPCALCSPPGPAAGRAGNSAFFAFAFDSRLPPCSVDDAVSPGKASSGYMAANAMEALRTSLLARAALFISSVARKSRRRRSLSLLYCSLRSAREATRRSSATAAVYLMCCVVSAAQRVSHGW